MKSSIGISYHLADAGSIRNACGNHLDETENKESLKIVSYGIENKYYIAHG